jgi:hypothetical protein
LRSTGVISIIAAMSSPRSLTALAATIVLCVAFPAAAPARSAPHCLRRAGQIAGDRYARLWHAHGALFGCTSDSTSATTRRLGPWSARSRFAWDGTEVAWSAPTPRAGDRVWAGVAGEAAWLRSSPALPRRVRRPARVQKLLVGAGAAAWITRGNDAVLALDAPEGDPMPVGDLPGALISDPTRVLVGSWPRVPARALAKTAKLTAGEGEDDECGGVTPYLFSVRPHAAAAPVGVVWRRTWATEDC